LLGWFARNARDLPWRRTLDPYAIWISEIMLQQTQVKTVIPYWERWLSELPTVQAAAECPEPRLLKLWEGLGYYRRARHLQKAARVIVKEHGGRFPRDFATVLALPGVGRYTAGAICSIAYNQPVPILDGNVIRVLTRCFAVPGDPRDKTTNQQLWQLADQLVQAAARLAPSSLAPLPSHLLLSGPCSALNQSLMELGATVCLPREPRCHECPLQRQCLARKLGLAGQLPIRGERVRTTGRRFVAFVVEHKGRFLVRRRAGDVVNSGLWEWPNLECAPKGTLKMAELADGLGLKLLGEEPLAVIRHSITRYRIELRAYHARVQSLSRLVSVRKVLECASPRARSVEAAVSKAAEGRRSPKIRRENGQTNDDRSLVAGELAWLSSSELDALAFSSAHRRVLQMLLRQSK